jgi:DNA (cytosine-5)-methyltransferase 1
MADGSGITVARKQRTLEVADLFCGAGGLSTGADRALRRMGRRMNLAGVNHWPTAIETNKRNHPEHAERIVCADLETALPLNHVPGGRLDLLMAAPSCVFHSRARGGRPVHDQQRMDPWHVIRWCTELRVARILIENVPEFMDWGPCSLVTDRPIKSRKGEYFRAWVAALQAVGFKVKFGVLCCADFGVRTSRRRFFLIGASDGGPLDFPEATHARAPKADLLGTRERWRGVRESIDWTLVGASIFTRKRPLKPNTIRRIMAGAVKYRWPQPYIDALQALLEGRTPQLTFTRAEAIALGLLAAELHEGITLSTGSYGAARELDDPLPTITTGGASSTVRPGCARPQLIEPVVMSVASGGAARDVGQPCPTITTGGNGARPQLVEPLLVELRGTHGHAIANTAQSTNSPVGTITAGGIHHSLAEPIIVPLSNSSSAGTPRGVDDPIRTVTTAKGGDQALAMPLVAPYYGGGSGLTASSVAEPVPSITTKARFGLAEPVLMRAGHGDSDGRDPGSRVLDTDAPMPALTGSNEVSLATPLVMRGNVGTGRTRDMRTVDNPIATITTSESLALAATTCDAETAEVRIDINYRMLHWRELARASSFDEGDDVYDFAGNATEITKQIGNAVPPAMADALVTALMAGARA